MNSAETQKSQWQSDPLLTGKRQKANFSRTAWDASQNRNFGAWSPESENASQTKSFQDHSPSSASNEPTTGSGELAPTTQPGIGQAAGQAHDASPANTNGHSPVDPSAESASAAAPAAYNEQHIRIARQQGYVQGLKDGMAKTLQDLESERATERDLIQAVTTEIAALQNDAFRLFEPLKKLALHIAEQLVRGELSTSGEAVERMVKACLADLNGLENGVSVSLNPHDLERVRPLLKNNEPPLLLHADMSLTSGSVRVRANDTTIEDLIENRLDGLARQLISEPETWLKNASSLAGLQVESVSPSFADLKKKSTEQEVDDVVEKAPRPMAQDIEEVSPTEPSPSPDMAPMPEPEMASTPEPEMARDAAPQNTNTDLAEHLPTPRPQAEATPQPHSNDGEQAYL